MPIRSFLASLCGIIAVFGSIFTPSGAYALLCSVDTGSSNVNFGNITMSPTDIQSSVTVNCLLVPLVESSVTYTISLSKGSSTSYTARTLKDGSATLFYNLYTDSARTQVWGDGTSGTQTITYTASGVTTASNHSIYGRVSYSALPAPGNYSDSITVTISY